MLVSRPRSAPPRAVAGGARTDLLRPPAPSAPPSGALTRSPSLVRYEDQPQPALGLRLAYIDLGQRYLSKHRYAAGMAKRLQAPHRIAFSRMHEAPNVKRSASLPGSMLLSGAPLAPPEQRPASATVIDALRRRCGPHRPSSAPPAHRGAAAAAGPEVAAEPGGAVKAEACIYILVQ